MIALSSFVHYLFDDNLLLGYPTAAPVFIYYNLLSERLLQQSLEIF